MGSWAELDAIYPAGALSPAAAFIVALGHLAGARSVYGGAPAPLAGFLARYALSYDRELLERAEHFLTEVPIDSFLEQARALLNPEQKLCLAVNLLDAALAAGAGRLAGADRLGLLLEGLGIRDEQLAPYQAALRVKNDLALFPQ